MDFAKDMAAIGNSYSGPNDLLHSTNDVFAVLDKLKFLVESFSGRKWMWWIILVSETTKIARAQTVYE